MRPFLLSLVAQMNDSLLLNDFYQLNMAYGYWRQNIHHEQAVFHLFFRRNPVRGDYVIASGLQSVIDYLTQFQFTDDDIHYLKSLPASPFPADFLAYLKTLRFTGDIDAVPEGSVVFAHEPLLRITAPLILCQLLETPLINLVNFSSAVATMASRIRTIVGKNDALFEFGLRRSQGPNGGLTASYAAFVGGFDATSNMLAGKLFGIPIVGTMSHSWVMAFDDELTAFKMYAKNSPDNVVLLVDTYHSETGIDRAIQIGEKLKGIRLDSGDLGSLSAMAREKLNHAGMNAVKIFVSGDLTEDRIDELKSIKAPIDGWGVGTHLSTSYEQPTLDMVYKLGAIEKNGQWHYKVKRSDNRIKTSDPGVLQVKRYYEKNHSKKWVRDIIYHVDFGVSENNVVGPNAEGMDLLIPIFRRGKLIYLSPQLSEIRKYAMEQVVQFHASKGLMYSVERDSRLLSLKEALLERCMK